ncbi:MAG: MMPL family transporter [Kiloniellales bacterium]|nr:MMPL family transporter [Kiloniellales bacterium]
MTETAGKAWLLLALALGFLAAATGVVFTLVPIRADVTVLMPEKQSRDLEVLFSALQKGPANRLILVALQPEDGAPALAAPAALSRAFKAKLRDSGFFGQVLNGEISLNQAAFEPFFAHRYHLNPPLDPESFTVSGLRRALQDLLSRLQGFEGPLVEDIMAADPTLRTLEVAALWRPAAIAAQRQGVWVGGDGTRVLLLARIRGAAFDFPTQEAMIRAVRTAAEDLEAEFGPLRLWLSGPSVIAVDSRKRNEAESQRLMLLCVPLVIGLLLLIFRRIAVLPLAVLPLISGFLAGTLAVAAVFGFVHISTLGFGVTLIGVSVDYPLHLVSRLRSAAAETAAVRRIWPALILGVLTTIFGFLPMVLSSFPGVAQLGVFTFTGLATAAAVTRWFLPRVAGTASGALRPWVAKTLLWRGLDLGRVRPIAVLLGVAALSLLLLRGEGVWQQDLASLSPLPESVRAEDRLLRQDLKAATPRNILTVTGATPEQVLRRSEALLPLLERLEAEGRLDGFDLAARYLPSRSTQETRLVRLPDDDVLGDRLAQALEGLPFTPGAFDPFLAALAAARAAQPLGPEDIAAEPLRQHLDGLLLARGDEATGLVSLRGSPKIGDLEAALDAAGLPGVALIDIKTATQDLMDSYLRETLVWAAVGGLLAILLLSLVLRSAGAVAQIALPVALSVLLTAAVMAQIGDGLSLFQILALLMVAGLGVDYAVFLRQSGQGELDARRDSALAVCLCAATSFCVFAALASASIPLLSQIGQTAAVGTVFSLLLGFTFAGSGQSETK